MDDRRDRRRGKPTERWRSFAQDPCSVATARLLAVVGIGPAVVYGGVAGGVAGAAVGVLLLVLLIGMVAWIRCRRHPGEPEIPVTEQPHVQDVFDQLIRTPCDRCGAATLLDTCLDCTALPPRRGGHKADGTPTDGPEGPGS